MPPYTKLQGVSDLSLDGIKTTLEQNLIDFFDYAFLEAGGFTTAPVLQPGVADPNALCQLYPVQKDGVADGRIWQAPHANWCHESGLESGYNPVVCSGVYVNGTLYPTSSTTGTYSHHLDFLGGRVVFNSALTKTAVVQAAHSFHWVGFHDQDVPWYQTIILDGYLTEQSAKGTSVLQVLSDYRVSVPLVVVEAVMRVDQHGYQLGSSALWTGQDVLFHVITQDKPARDRIVDALTRQEGHSVYLYHTGQRRQAGDFPLDWKGTPVPSARTYPQLVENPPVGFRWQTALLKKVRGEDVSQRLPLYRGVVRVTVEMVSGGL